MLRSTLAAHHAAVGPEIGFIVYEGPSLLTGEPIVAILTKGSNNRKTGDMPQLWVLRQDRAPHIAAKDGSDEAICGHCPHRYNPRTGVRTCYVLTFNAPRSVWAAWTRGRYKVATARDLRRITAGRTVRLGAYGDPAALPRDVLLAVTAHAAGHVGYTHQWREGFALQDLCMASAESPADVVDAAALGYRAFRTTRGVEPRAPGAMVCPASEEAGRRLSCDTCGACSGAGARRATSHVQIAIHGQAALRA